MITTRGEIERVATSIPGEGHLRAHHEVRNRPDSAAWALQQVDNNRLEAIPARLSYFGPFFRVVGQRAGHFWLRIHAIPRATGVIGDLSSDIRLDTPPDERRRLARSP